MSWVYLEVHLANVNLIVNLGKEIFTTKGLIIFSYFVQHEHVMLMSTPIIYLLLCLGGLYYVFVIYLVPCGWCLVIFDDLLFETNLAWKTTDSI